MSRSGARPAAIGSSLAAIAMVAAALASGVLGYMKEASVDFRWAPQAAFPPEITRVENLVRTNLPEGAPILYVHPDPDPWLPGLWQRALYPRHVYVVQEREGPSPTARAVAKVLGIRYAVSAGEPPRDLGFRWRVPLPRLSGYPVDYVLGELAPR